VIIIEGENSPGAEINVQSAGNDIPTNSTVNLGDVPVGTHKDVEFTIQGTGFSDLELGYPAVSIDGANEVEFSIIDDPATIVSPGHSTTFTVRFSPATVGAKSAFLTIPSNDSDEDPYIINLTANNAAAAGVLNHSHHSVSHRGEKEKENYKPRTPMVPTLKKHSIKSFSGDSKGGGFSKKPPLAAGGNVENTSVLVLRDRQGNICFYLDVQKC
jgi:hypothetical protein